MQTINQTTSKDGTIIGYRQWGNGPGLILVHGGLMSSTGFEGLAKLLSESYTVYVPDRRGRGLSGQYGGNYNLSKECEDIQALVNKTGARYIFGLSSGALIALQATLRVSGLQKTALYEPPLIVPGSNPIDWTGRYERELAQGKLASAFLTIIKGTADSWSFMGLPRFILVPLVKLLLNADAKKAAKEGEVTIKSLIPTLHYDFMLVAETEGKLGTFKNIQTPVLLLGGGRSKSYLKKALDALGNTLPHFQRIEFPKAGHIVSVEKPEIVAKELKKFFVG